ncbi:C40 family peptidase, partial [Cellulomonas hominis]|nr:C40 family peptidase [Cellulomonas hominis]
AASSAAGLAGHSGLGKVAGAASTLADPNATATEKVTETAAAGAEAAVTAAVGAAASPIVGKVAGKVTGAALRDRRIQIAIGAAILMPLLAMAVAVLMVLSTVNQAGTLLATIAAAQDEEYAENDDYCYFPGVDDSLPILLLTSEQTANARTIVSTVASRSLGPQDAVIAIMTALTESGLRNVDYGDDVGPDSRGLFQQRDSWGPYEVRMDPAGATGLFLDALTSPGLTLYRTSTLVNASPSTRASLTPWLVAQSVQRSAFADGNNYQAKYSQAVAIVRAIMGDAAASVTDPWVAPTGAGGSMVTCADGGTGSTLPASEKAGAAITWGKTQLGKPYVWGATGPNSYDCSGFTMRAWESAGVPITRTSRSQYSWGASNGRLVPLAEAQPGDLLFWANNTSNPGSIYHVGIWMDANTVMHAPNPSTVVKIAPIFNRDKLMPYVVRPA